MAEPTVQILLCWSPAPRQVHEHPVRVPAGCTVKAAVEACLSAGVPGMSEADLGKLPFMHPGIWGRKVLWSTRVHEGDRIELYRDLLVDPKVARRQRFKRQGKGRTGLFANRKTGAAAGY